jgi:hypothetical protein
MNIEWLNEFTKKELIMWIRQESEQERYIITTPKKSSLLFLRWQNESRKAEDIRAKSLAMLQSCDGKSMDELAEKFNKETDSNKKLAIWRQMKPHAVQFKKWLDYEKIVNEQEKKVDKIYAEMETARKMEAEEKVKAGIENS